MSTYLDKLTVTSLIGPRDERTDGAGLNQGGLGARNNKRKFRTYFMDNTTNKTSIQQGWSEIRGTPVPETDKVGGHI